MLHAVRDALLKSGDIDIVGLTHLGEEVVALVEEHAPDVVLLDGHMPGVDGLTCLKEIKLRWPEMRVVMLSASENPKEIGDALAAGASAYIGKRISPQDLASALRQVVAGVVHHRSSHYEEPVAAVPAVVAESAVLTAREQTILGEMALGHSTKVISRDLWITEKTVKFHLTNIYRKLEVNNRTGALRHAYEHNMLLRPLPEQSAAATLTG
jgi:DNA-binding NarL/FixJ family response regulator